MIGLEIRASKNYPVYISDTLDYFSEAVKTLKGDKVAVVTDDVVDALYGDEVCGRLTGKTVFKIVVTHGEQSKNAENYIKILDLIAEKGFKRSDGIVALGGGVVGDLAAFCASTYMRGISLLAVPTTILSAVDSSVGGKTAINLARGKNLCGTFYQPDAVYICTEFFKTLSAREVACGYGEIIKYAFLSADVTKEDIKGGVTEELIYKCLKIKAAIVERDERESGDRKLLNLGHTIGHAIERLSDFSISHGECVAKGLYAILNISRRFYGFDDQTYNKALDIISARGHDLSCPFSPDEIFDKIGADKKSDDRGVDLVLIGRDLMAKIEKVDYEKLKEMLKWTSE